MSYGACGDMQLVRQQAGHKVAIAVVADEQVWLAAQVLQDCFADIQCELLQVWPYLKPAVHVCCQYCNAVNQQ